MANLNKLLIIGRLTADPELRHTANSSAVTDLRLAVNRSWTDKAGQRQEETLFIDVTAWNRTAENCCQYLRKGSSVFVEGHLKTESWPDKQTGEKRTKIKGEADNVQFLDAPKSGTAPAPQRDREPARSSWGGNGMTPTAQPARRGPNPPDPQEPDDEDIPFAFPPEPCPYDAGF